MSVLLRQPHGPEGLAHSFELSELHNPPVSNVSTCRNSGHHIRAAASAGTAHLGYGKHMLSASMSRSGTARYSRNISASSGETRSCQVCRLRYTYAARSKNTSDGVPLYVRIERRKHRPEVSLAERRVGPPHDLHVLLRHRLLRETALRAFHLRARAHGGLRSRSCDPLPERSARLATRSSGRGRPRVSPHCRDPRPASSRGPRNGHRPPRSPPESPNRDENMHPDSGR